jgi:ectoine hydroxylase-related dioxygenase (phytanoyl-CoA dioxygenase family)
MPKNNLTLFNYSNELFNNGYVIIENFINKKKISLLRREILHATEIHNKNNVFDKYMIHNCFLFGDEMLNLLKSSKLRKFTDTLLCKNSIIYAYQSSSIPPNNINYGYRIHKDTPRFIPNYRTNLGFILALDDFTDISGATEVLPGSHKNNNIPKSDFFNKNKKKLICNSGSAIFFDANLWHKAGKNIGNKWRYALTINFCRPYMRSRFDFPRMIKDVNLKIPNNKSLRKYLGFDVRIPTCLEDFYKPSSERLYKANQE